MPKILLSEFVEPDLATIWDFIALDNAAAADRVVEAVYRTFEDLARMAGMGQARPFPQARLRELRSFRVKGFTNYLVFYSPIPDGIEVFHVLHAARDLKEALEGE